MLTALFVCLCNVPNVLPARSVAEWPQWAQRRLVLGLDLRGGSYLLLEVDRNAVASGMIQSLRDRVQRSLDKARINYTHLTTSNESVQVRFAHEAQLDEARKALQRLVEPLGGMLRGRSESSIAIIKSSDNTLELKPTPADIDARVHGAAEASLPVVERRVNELGTVEPTIETEGSDRIVVEVPGLRNPTRLEALLGKTAKLTFHLVNLSVSPEQAVQGKRPPDTEILYDKQSNPYLVDKHVALSGDDLIDAEPTFDQRTGRPIVSFTLNEDGARQFADVTRENVDRPFAIVLDNQVVSAPVIREPIVTGSGEISGNFTVEEANDLAVLLRAGALPAPLTIIEERTVGPGLGQDSIRSGETAAFIGALLVVCFMLATYGLFGAFASIAVAINVAMMLGLLSLLSATLTLPGIAGILLTVGIAVDSNVLVYERIREELRRGSPPVNAIDAGFRRAFATILDSNIATLIAATVLFLIGSGPVRGFAVTLGVGIATTLFTAFTLTRLMISWWVRLVRPRTVPV